MSSVAEVVAELASSLSQVPNLRVYTDLSATVAPPGAVIGPPALTWAMNGPTATTARFSIAVVTSVDARSLERLWDLVPLVTSALYEATDVVVLGATPGVWSPGGSELPCYEISIEVGVN